MEIRRWMGAALLLAVLVGGAVPAAKAQGVFDRMKQKAKDTLTQQADQKTDAATDATDGREPADR